MVFKREEELVNGLKSENKLKALKSIRNALIGDKSKKASLVKVGCVARLVEVLQTQVSPATSPSTADDEKNEPIVQALVALGSFAYGSDVGLRAVLESNALNVILSDRILGCGHPRIVEAACRSLKQIYASDLSPRDTLFSSDEGLRCLLTLLTGDRAAGGASSAPEDATWMEIAELAAQVVSSTCVTAAHQGAVLRFTGAGGLTPFVDLLHRPRLRSRQAGLDLLSVMVFRNTHTADMLLGEAGRRGVGTVIQLARSDDASTRLKATHVLTCLAEAWPTHASGPSTSITTPSDAPSPMRYEKQYLEVTRVALGVLLRLAAEAPYGAAPGLLARLLRSSEMLQRNACGSNTLSKLLDVLKGAELATQPAKAREGVLRCVAAFCMRLEDNRRAVVEAKLMPSLVQWLKEGSPEIKSAVCELVWALSRSFKVLRTAFTEVDVVPALLDCLAHALTHASDPTQQAISAGASAALSNMVLEYGPVKEQLIREGAVGKLCELAKPSTAQADVRINALWALENLVFMSKPTVRDAVRKELPWSALCALMDEADPVVQEKAFGILQNLLYGGPPEIQTTLDWAEGKLPACLETKLRALADAASGEPTKTTTNALYVAVNLATGSEAHKDLLLSQGIAATLPQFVREGRPVEVQVAALWAVINLIWIEPKTPQGLSTRLPTTDRTTAPHPAVAMRAQQLKALGLEDSARALSTFKTPLFVRERAQGALDAFTRATQNLTANLTGDAPGGTAVADVLL